MSEKVSKQEPKTLGIPPAVRGALQVLQFTPMGDIESSTPAAQEIAKTHELTEDQQNRCRYISSELSAFLQEIVENCPPGPERSTAISRAREAKFWACSSIALEGK